ncbi:DUF6388 family protein [Massilia sp. METH4]|uniref:DUF6388 family protein n=1 Tax=Massilia sp. METH4 TaxID=3123041 RepID=UPI0030CCBF75
MPKLTPAQLTKAARLFLGSKPASRARVMSLTQADADVMETSLDELRLATAMDEIEKFARENGRDAMEIRYSLAAETAEEFDRMWREYQSIIKQQLGLSHGQRFPPERIEVGSSVS